MNATVHSFRDLACLFGIKRAGLMVKDSSYKHVASVCGAHAAVLWAWIDQRERSRTFGRPSELWTSPERLSEVTGWPLERVQKYLTALLKGDFIRVDWKGEKVAAA